MERSLARSGVRLRSSRVADNQRPPPEQASMFLSSKVSSSPEDRGRNILLRLLRQITEFLERKEMMSSRVAASKEWRKSRSRRRSESSNNLFEVVIQVCEQRMRRLERSSSRGYGRDQDEWSTQSPRVLVAEAIVQELLVSLMELRMKEKETLVMDEVEDVEVMRKLHGHLQKDEEMVRNKVCVGAGDEQQLEELQAMLRTDFLEEVTGAGSPQKQQQVDSAASNEASLQFAWETIDDQKKEIIRLRAENEELKRADCKSDAASALQASFFDEEPTKVINLLRSQLSSHHEKNLNILHDHIQRLENALQSATALSRKSRQGWDGSKSAFSSSSRRDKEDWSTSILSRSTAGTDISRTQIPKKKCEECRKNLASLLAIRSEVKQLRAQSETDEESLLQAEKDRGQLQRENSALSTALLSAKQKQEELRQMILDLTEEKHQLQNLGDSEQRTSERSIRVLKEQLNALEEQKAYQKRKFDELTNRYDAEVREKQALTKQCASLQDAHDKLSQSTTELQELVSRLDGDARRCERLVKDRESLLTDLKAQVNSMEKSAESLTAELQDKEELTAELRAEISKLRLGMDNLEGEKRVAAGENERLLQTLDECKRKNQRLERGFEELKQGKELLASLQQVERGASALQFSELQQVREQFESLKLELASTKSEYTQLEKALSEATKANKSLRSQHSTEIEVMQRELGTMQQKCESLDKKLATRQKAQSELVVAKQNADECATVLSQELDESKTAMLMWMTKFNAVCEDKQKLENEVQGLSEEQHSLLQRIEELEAEHEVAALAQQKSNENELELKKQIHCLNEQHQTVERERRVMEQEKKALVKLVQTLQARPELQQRAFREMLLTCQRGTERTFCQLSERVTVTLEKLAAVEGQYETLKTRVVSRKQTCQLQQDEDSSSDEGECPVAPKQVLPQITVQEDDFFGVSSFNPTASQPAWLEVIGNQATSNCSKPRTHHDETNDEVESLTRVTQNEQLKLWKWKFFVKSLAENSSRRENAALIRRLKDSSRANNQLRKTIQISTWHKFKAKVENLQLGKLHHLTVVLCQRLSRELQLKKQIQCFEKWKYQAQVQIYQAKVRASVNDPLRPSFSPTTTMALANCIQLVRKFCEPERKTDKRGTSERTNLSQVHGTDELAGYLVEINTKVASWKVTMDRKIAEYAERSSQLKSVQRRCAELKDLVGLNQRLIEEMERRSASQQSVMEAAWDFATAYKALSPSARAQVFQSRDFLSASKGIVEGLNSLGLPRSVSKLSQTVGPSRHPPSHTQDTKAASSHKINFLSMSAAPGVISANNSLSEATTEKSRKRLNDSNIELLEDAVGSLKGAMQKQRNLQLELKEKERSLTATTKELSKRNMQFLLLRSFLQWKCASLNLAPRQARKQPKSTISSREAGR